MDKNAALVSGLPPALDEYTSDPNTRITTIWPRALGTYTVSHHPLRVEEASPHRRFLTGPCMSVDVVGFFLIGFFGVSGTLVP